MATATKMVGKPEAAVTFLARRDELRLIKKAERFRRNAEGDVVESIPGERIVFRDGVLKVPLTGTIAGENGDALDAPEVIAWLQGHKLRGDRQEGFWELEEPAPAPSEDELTQLQMLAEDLDAKGLERYIGEERDGWAREKLLAIAEGSLVRVKAKVEELEAQKAEAVAAAKAEATVEAKKPAKA